MEIYKCLLYLGYKPDIDFLLFDDADGKGSYIQKWYHPDPQPTKKQLKDVEKDAITKASKEKDKRDKEDELKNIDVVSLTMDLIAALPIAYVEGMPQKTKDEVVRVKKLKEEIAAL